MRPWIYAWSLLQVLEHKPRTTRTLTNQHRNPCSSASIRGWFFSGGGFGFTDQHRNPCHPRPSVAGFSEAAVSGSPINTEIRVPSASIRGWFFSGGDFGFTDHHRNPCSSASSRGWFFSSGDFGFTGRHRNPCHPRPSVAGFSQAAISALPINTEIRVIRAHPWLVFLRRRFRVYGSTQKSVSSAPIRGWFFSSGDFGFTDQHRNPCSFRVNPWLVFLRRRFRVYRSTQKSVSSALVRGWFFSGGRFGFVVDRRPALRFQGVIHKVCDHSCAHQNHPEREGTHSEHLLGFAAYDGEPEQQ